MENSGTGEQSNERAGKPLRQWEDRQKISAAVYEIMSKIRQEGRSWSSRRNYAKQAVYLGSRDDEEKTNFVSIVEKEAAGH